MSLLLPETTTVGWRYRHRTDLFEEVAPLLRAFAEVYATSDDPVRDALRTVGPNASLLRRFESASGAFQLRREELYPPSDLDPIAECDFHSQATGERLSVSDPDVDGCLAIAEVLRACGNGRSAEAVRLAMSEPARALLEGLVDAKLVVETLAGAPSPRRRPGIVRLQHASVAISSETTTVLVDPHFRSRYTAPGCSMDPRSFACVDAVLVSHSHPDHWDLPSLMTLPPTTPVVVPHVPRESIVCDAMGARLRTLGFTRVLEPAWNGPAVRIGDIKVYALPFYGEQPTLDEAPREPALRNWGSTYYVRTPQISAWLLIDSGADHLGSMLDVATRVRARFGGVDVILSNLRAFRVGIGVGSPYYVAGGSYWLSLTADQIRRFHSLRGQQITLGPAGVADVCRAAGARAFLPYAHLWAPPGAAVQGEEQVVAELGPLLDAETSLLAWKIGDAMVASRRGGSLTLTLAPSG